MTLRTEYDPAEPPRCFNVDCEAPIEPPGHAIVFQLPDGRWVFVVLCCACRERTEAGEGMELVSGMRGR